MKRIWSTYGKAIMAVVTAAVVAGVTITSGDGRVSGEEWFQLVTEIVTAVGVWMVPALPEYPWVKTAQAGLMAALLVGVTVLLDGVSVNDILVIGVAVLGVIGVASSPSRSAVR